MAGQEEDPEVDRHSNRTRFNSILPLPHLRSLGEAEKKDEAGDGVTFCFVAEHTRDIHAVPPCPSVGWCCSFFGVAKLDRHKRGGSSPGGASRAGTLGRGLCTGLLGAPDALIGRAGPTGHSEREESPFCGHTALSASRQVRGLMSSASAERALQEREICGRSSCCWPRVLNLDLRATAGRRQIMELQLRLHE